MAGRNAFMDMLQSASNSAADTVSGPVNMLAWALRKAGVPVPQNALGSSEWMAQQGLTREVPQGLPRIAGETLGLVAPFAVAARAPQIANGLNQMAANAQVPRTMNPQRGAVVYHGSPHKFDAFDASKIGTGEGAQAYGHGLYLAENPRVATEYSKMNPTVLQSPVRAFKGAELAAGTPEYHAATLLDSMGLQQARKTVSGWIANADPRMTREAEGWAKTLETLNAATSKADFKKLKNSGSLYKVDLPDEKITRMLDWDKPLHRQAPEVRKAVRNVVEQQAGQGSYAPWLRGSRPDFRTMSNDMLENLSEPQIAELLRKQGIPGIRYLDGGSRGVGTGTSNFVVFPGEENALRILERNGAPIGK